MFRPTNYPREKYLDPRNTHEKTFRTHKKPSKAQCYDGTRPTRPTMASDSLNLAHSLITNKSCLKEAQYHFNN